MKTLTDRVALVTGGSRGLGAAIAERLAQEGARVIINYKERTDDAKACKQRLDAVGVHPVSLIQADISKQEKAQGLIAAIHEEFGGLDIVVNNAGVMGPVAAIENASLDDWVRAMETNFWGALYVTRAALPLMKQNKGGRLVYLSVNFTGRPAIRLAPYATSKAAIEALAYAAANEGGMYGITSNIVIPGPMDTELGGRTVQLYRDNPSLARDHFMNPDHMSNEAVGNAVVMLSKSPYLTAQKMYVDNGWQRKFIIPRGEKK